MTPAPIRRLTRALLVPPVLVVGVLGGGSALAEPNQYADSHWLLPAAPSQMAMVPDENDERHDAVTVPSPESIDQAIALLRQTEEAQSVADSIARTLASSKVELASAQILESLANDAVTEAAGPVSATTSRVNALAARTYMSGGASEWMALLQAETPQDAIDVSMFASYVSSVSSARIAEAKRARAAAEAAARHAANSTTKRQTLERRVLDLEGNLVDAQLTISTSIAAYQAYINRPGPQTRIGPNGCPVEAPANSMRGGSETVGIAKLCRKSVAKAASPQAALAIMTAFSRLGAPYACEGVGRLGAWRFDCSSLVSRAYSESSGIPVAGAGWAPSTRKMIPWDGESLDPHYVRVEEEDIRPGDLLLYRSCTTPPCNYQHVVMALADGYILHTNDCGDIAHVTLGKGYGPGSNFVVARRVVHIEGESLLTPLVSFPGSGVDPTTFLTKRQFEELQERRQNLLSDASSDAAAGERNPAE
jgi:cell wall-associated NlpC family hydrolase